MRKEDEYWDKGVMMMDVSGKRGRKEGRIRVDGQHV